MHRNKAASSLDHLVGECEQVAWNGEAPPRRSDSPLIDMKMRIDARSASPLCHASDFVLDQSELRRLGDAHGRDRCTNSVNDGLTAI